MMQWVLLIDANEQNIYQIYFNQILIKKLSGPCSNLISLMNLILKSNYSKDHTLQPVAFYLRSESESLVCALLDSLTIWLEHIKRTHASNKNQTHDNPIIIVSFAAILYWVLPNGLHHFFTLLFSLFSPSLAAYGSFSRFF